MGWNLDELGFKPGDTTYHVVRAKVGRDGEPTYEPYSDEWLSKKEGDTLSRLQDLTCEAYGRKAPLIDIMATMSKSELQQLGDDLLEMSLQENRITPKSKQTRRSQGRGKSRRSPGPGIRGVG